MSAPFDPYYKWLGIPPAEQPPNAYRLLGLRDFEDDPDVIDSAADQRMRHLRSFQNSKQAALSQKLLNEVTRARSRLLDPEEKAEYDAQLRERQGSARQANSDENTIAPQSASNPATSTRRASEGPTSTRRASEGQTSTRSVSEGPQSKTAWPEGKAPATLDEFHRCLEASRLLTAEESRKFAASLPAGKQPDSPKALATELLKAARLTRFQTQGVLQGKLKYLSFGEYVILEKLGQGGMGQVLKAEHRRMKRIVALKVISGAAMKNADAVRRFQREVHAAARLIHTNIVTAFDANEHEGIHFFVMEYVAGKDLSQLVKDAGPLPVQQAVDYVLQAARGLAYAHSKGIVHRDIKPGNLLVDGDGTVKILDMGLARIDLGADDGQELTNTGQVMGTVDYMAPEQAEDTHSADARADIYSLGCTLYRLIAGDVLYGGDTLMKKLLAHRSAPIPSLAEQASRLPEQSAALGRLDPIFQRMVAKRPEDRQQAMAQVVAELEAFLRGEQPAAAASAAPEPTQDLKLSEFLAGVGSRKGKGATAVAAKPKPTETQFAGSEATQDFRAGDTSPTILTATPLAAVAAPPVTSSLATAAPQKRKSIQAWLKKNPVALLIATAVMGLGLAAAGIVIFVPTPDGTIRIEINDPSLEVTISDNGYKIKGKTEEIHLKPGEHGLHVKAGDLEFDTQKFSVQKGGNPTIQVELLPGKMRVVQSDGNVLGEKISVASGGAAGNGGSTDNRSGSLRELQPGNFALEFNGTDSRVDLPTLRYDGSHPITLEATIVNYQVIERGVVIGDQTDAGLRLNFPTKADAGARSHGLFGNTRATGIFYVIVTRDPLVPQRRMQVAAVLDGKTGYLFIDGKLQNQGQAFPGDFLPAKSSLMIGNCLDPTNRSGFDGLIDEVRVSKIARYSSNYTPVNRFEPDRDTLALYHFDEGRGEVLNDSSGNGHHGKIVGAKWVPAGTAAAAISSIDLRKDKVQVVQADGLKLGERGGPTAIPNAADDRAAALSLHTYVNLTLKKDGGAQVDIKRSDSLPDGPFALQKISVPADAKLPENFTEAVFLPAIANLHELEWFQDYSSRVQWNEADVSTLANMPCTSKLGGLLSTIPLNKDTLAHLSKLPKLRYLCGAAHQPNDELWAALGRLPAINDLRLNYVPRTARLGPAAAKALSSLPLTQLGIGGTLDAECARALAQMKTLRHLTLIDDAVEDAALTELLRSQAIKQIVLEQGTLTDEQILRFATMKQLESLSLRSQKASPTVMNRLAVELPACSLYWNGGQIKPKAKSSQPATSPTPDSLAAEWIPLFNGRNLDGWVQKGNAGWSVKDGVLTGVTQEAPGWLMSQQEFDNFEIELEYKLPPGGNSGVFLRAPEQDAISGSQFNEIQLLDDTAANFSNVPTVGRNGSLWMALAPKNAPATPPNEWHALAIRAFGRRLQITLKGTRIVDGDFPPNRAARGHVGLQLYPPEVSFRNIRIRELMVDGNPSAATSVAMKPLGSDFVATTLATDKPALDFNFKLPKGYARVDMPKVLKPTEACTFEVYFTPRGDAGRNRHICGMEPCYWLKLDGKELLEWVGPRAGGWYDNRVSVANALSLGRRSHLAAVFTGKDFLLFVDGKEQGKKPLLGTIPATFDWFCLGGRPEDDTTWSALNGLMDEVRISQVARYATNFTPPAKFAADKDTLILYDFHEGQGDVLNDVSGNGHHGKIIGAKWIKPSDAASAATSGVVFLDDLQEKSFLGRGALKKPDKSPADFEELRNNFSVEIAPHALSFHPSPEAADKAEQAQVTYDLAGNYDRFQTTVFCRPTRGTPIFAEVWGDGKRLWESENLVPQLASGVTADVDVRGVRELKLTLLTQITTQVGAVLWQDPRLTRSAKVAGVISGSSKQQGTPSTADFGPVTLVPPPNSKPNSPPAAIVPFSASQARASQAAWAKYLGLPVEFKTKRGIALRLVPPGECEVGIPARELDKINADWKARNVPQPMIDNAGQALGKHRVRLSEPYYMATLEFPRAEYLRLGLSPQGDEPGRTGEDLPINLVTWLDAIDLCNRLSQDESLPPYYRRDKDKVTIAGGAGYRLPTNAEWEFAYRAGSDGEFPWAGGERETDHGWFLGNSYNVSHPRGQKKPNAFGLYDMSGNLFEWCWDYCWPYAEFHLEGKTLVDPLGPPSQADRYRVLRGGSFGDMADLSRAWFRYAFVETEYCNSGVRVVRTAVRK